jgi:hypothetical protein
MLTPDEWAVQVLKKKHERESAEQEGAERAGYEAFDNELEKLWLRTRAVFEEYIQAFCRKEDTLRCDTRDRAMTITRTDLAHAEPLNVLYSSHGVFNGIEVCLGAGSHRYEARLTDKGLELVREGTDELPTCPEEIAANALENLLIQ